MTRSGIQHPDVVDLISQATDGTVRLILAEVDPLTGHQVVPLQEKLTNYLSYAADGHLVTSTPSAKGCPVCIRVDLYARPDVLILEFLRGFRALALQKGVDLEVSINQETVVL